MARFSEDYIVLTKCTWKEWCRAIAGTCCRQEELIQKAKTSPMEMWVPPISSPLALATAINSIGHHSLGLLLSPLQIFSWLYHTTQLNLRMNFLISFSLFYFSYSYADVNIVKVEFCKKNKREYRINIVSLPLGEGTIFLEGRCMENFKCKADILDLSNVSSRKQVQKIIPYARSCAIPCKCTAGFSQRSLVCCSRTVLVLKEHTQISLWSRVTGHTMDWGGPGDVLKRERAAAPKELCVEAWWGMCGQGAVGWGGPCSVTSSCACCTPKSSGSYVLYHWELFGTSLCAPRACWGASMGMQVQQSRGLCQRSELQIPTDHSSCKTLICHSAERC